ncbi:hypothetical protein M378DRAFT_597247 [Amanita muscaria Koide BX008]|uniref:Uncharacterized protein n=1 Tax=Amanita muscaria (strain Koide BX008) TaxID=946122 RepID=A0A0C2RYK8_AMAMK|nr:hypothetical protein M378DRAFT_597247 [Amanita muscaria Koide BX008]
MKGRSVCNVRSYGYTVTEATPLTPSFHYSNVAFSYSERWSRWKPRPQNLSKYVPIYNITLAPCSPYCSHLPVVRVVFV